MLKLLLSGGNDDTLPRQNSGDGIAEALADTDGTFDKPDTILGDDLFDYLCHLNLSRADGQNQRIVLVQQVIGRIVGKGFPAHHAGLYSTSFWCWDAITTDTLHVMSSCGPLAELGVVCITS